MAAAESNDEASKWHFFRSHHFPAIVRRRRGRSKGGKKTVRMLEEGVGVNSAFDDNVSKNELEFFDHPFRRIFPFWQFRPFQSSGNPFFVMTGGGGKVRWSNFDGGIFEFYAPYKVLLEPATRTSFYLCGGLPSSCRALEWKFDTYPFEGCLARVCAWAFLPNQSNFVNRSYRKFPGNKSPISNRLLCRLVCMNGLVHHTLLLSSPRVRCRVQQTCIRVYG